MNGLAACPLALVVVIIVVEGFCRWAESGVWGCGMALRPLIGLRASSTLLFRSGANANAD